MAINQRMQSIDTHRLKNPAVHKSFFFPAPLIELRKGSRSDRPNHVIDKIQNIYLPLEEFHG